MVYSMNYCEITKRHYSTTGGWWPCEVNALRSMLADGYSNKQIASVLDRQHNSVFQKIRAVRAGKA